MPLNPVPNYPASLDSLPDPTSTTYADDDGFELDLLLQKLNAIAEALEAKTGVGATVPARNKALIGGASGSVWDTLGRRNVLINGGMQVQQRTTLPTVDNAYCLDRWRLLMESASSCTVSQETTDVPADGSGFAVRLNATATNNNKFGIYQMVEQREHHRLRGKTVSLQFKAKVSNARIGSVRAAVLQAGGTADAQTADPVSAWGAEGVAATLAGTWALATGGSGQFTPTTSWVTYRLEGIVLSSAMTNLSVLIYSDDKTTTSGDYLVITDVQLEEGAVCSEVDRLPYALELASCQRFYEQLGGENTVESVGAGSCFAATLAICFVPYVRKRTVPTVTVSAAADWQVLSGASTIAMTAFATGSITTRALAANCTVAGGLTIGDGATMRANSTAAARIFLDAEL